MSFSWDVCMWTKDDCTGFSFKQLRYLPTVIGQGQGFINLHPKLWAAGDAICISHDCRETCRAVSGRVAIFWGCDSITGCLVVLHEGAASGNRQQLYRKQTAPNDNQADLWITATTETRNTGRQVTILLFLRYAENEKNSKQFCWSLSGNSDSARRMVHLRWGFSHFVPSLPPSLWIFFLWCSLQRYVLKKIIWGFAVWNEKILVFQILSILRQGVDTHL